MSRISSLCHRLANSLHIWRLYRNQMPTTLLKCWAIYPSPSRLIASYPRTIQRPTRNASRNSTIGTARKICPSVSPRCCGHCLPPHLLKSNWKTQKWNLKRVPTYIRRSQSGTPLSIPVQSSMPTWHRSLSAKLASPTMSHLQRPFLRTKAGQVRSETIAVHRVASQTRFKSTVFSQHHRLHHCCPPWWTPHDADSI